MADRTVSTPLRMIVQYALTVLLLWLLTRYLPQYLVIDGGPLALPTVAALLFLLNTFARPILKVLTFPLKLFMTIAAVVLSNALFLWILVRIAERFDPSVAIVLIEGGIGGWIVIALALGIGNWILHHVTR